MEITIREETIERLSRELQRFTPKAKKMVASEVKRQGNAARKALLKTMTAYYAVKQKDLKDGLRVSVTQGRTVTAAIRAVGNGRYKVAAYDFSLSSKNKPHLGRGKYHKLHLMKGNAGKRFKKGFIAKMQNGHIGFFERTDMGIMENRRSRTGGRTKHNAKISEITGLAIAQMIKADEIEVIYRDAQDELTERLQGLIERIRRGEVS